MADQSAYQDLTIDVAAGMSVGDDPTQVILRNLAYRLSVIQPEQARHRMWCDRADALYLAEEFTRGGADLWADDPNANTPGRSHVSVNTPPVYVDVPAALQAVVPIENMLATKNTPEARRAAAAYERIYTAWKVDQDYELKFHKACTVKSLYGHTASKVYWDKERKKVCIEVIEQPRNLWLGYKTDEYQEIEWAAYVNRMDPNAVAEEFGVDVSVRNVNGAIVPFVEFGMSRATTSRAWLNFGTARIEVWDYWYRQAAKPLKKGTPGKMETWNVIIAGNEIVRGPVKYPEYKGAIPYIPLMNTFVPGVPDGRPNLYDMEPLIRETYERITSGSQMIHAGTSGDFWQLTGPEAPQKGDIKPIRNAVVYPGAGNRIETITPFIAQFQLEQFMGRLDRSKAEVSGMNDFLLGLAPAQMISSSKALNALIANYETRISMPRLLLYHWRLENWEMVSSILVQKEPTVAKVVDQGGGRLEITDPSLSPRDEMETATRAIALVNSKLWSQRRGMDAVHVDDPETEQDMIREERTDATLFPADVQVMAQLMAALKSLQLTPPPGATDQANQQLASGQNDLRTALGGATPGGTNASQGPEVQGLMQAPPEAQSGAGGMPFAVPPPQAAGEVGPAGPPGPASGPGPVGTAQTMIQGGKAKSRILTQQQLGRR